MRIIGSADKQKYTDKMNIRRMFNAMKKNNDFDQFSLTEFTI